MGYRTILQAQDSTTHAHCCMELHLYFYIEEEKVQSCREFFIKCNPFYTHNMATICGCTYFKMQQYRACVIDFRAVNVGLSPIVICIFIPILSSFPTPTIICLRFYNQKNNTNQEMATAVVPRMRLHCPSQLQQFEQTQNQVSKM